MGGGFSEMSRGYKGQSISQEKSDKVPKTDFTKGLGKKRKNTHSNQAKGPPDMKQLREWVDKKTAHTRRVK